MVGVSAGTTFVKVGVTFGGAGVFEAVRVNVFVGIKVAVFVAGMGVNVKAGRTAVKVGVLVGSGVGIFIGIWVGVGNRVLKMCAGVTIEEA